MIAHINGTKEQSVREHCLETARLSSKYAAAIKAEKIGMLQGILHDAGKLTTAFQEYIRQNMRHGKIDHSYAGAKYLCELADRDVSKFRDVSKLIAHTILSHHGLHDWIDDKCEDYCAFRIHKTEGYQEVQKNIGDLISNADLLSLLKQAEEEYKAIKAEIKKFCAKKKRVYAFYHGMLERFLQSCLIDADRSNTADFMSGASCEKQYDTDSVWKSALKNMNERCADFSKHTDIISQQRCSISDRCAAFAKNSVGACRLIVPTGGGKTLSSLRFAIEYCIAHGTQKIIYTAPFMSILEQNSDEIRKIVGNENIVEHHSNFLAEIDGIDELQEYELRAEKWDSPVVSTTMVQLLNTLFAGKSSAVRRMHRLSNAVIIIDEVQSLPLKCVYMFNLAVNFLTSICGSTVVLCSATQPALDEIQYPIILDNENMSGDIAKDFEIFRRTDVSSVVTPYGNSYDEAVDFCIQKFEENGNLLLIVNTKTAARTMFEKISDKSNAKIIHLSTNLCPAHRRKKIEEMRRCLAENIPIICVTTQLIEAGVDISFRCVVRSLAGLDSIAQAAGRCNRNGEYLTQCPVYIIKLKEENTNSLEDINQKQQITQGILKNTKDYLSYEVQNEYFSKLYRQAEKKLPYPVRADDIETTIFELLSTNKDRFNMSGLPKRDFFKYQAFKTAGSLFNVIDSNTQDVIVPYNEEAYNIIKELDEDITPGRCQELLRKAQKFSVGVYKGQSIKLWENNALRQLKTGAFALEDRFYDADLGVVIEGAEREFLLY